MEYAKENISGSQRMTIGGMGGENLRRGKRSPAIKDFTSLGGGVTGVGLNISMVQPGRGLQEKKGILRSAA